MRGSRSMAKLLMEFLVKNIVSFFKKSTLSSVLLYRTSRSAPDSHVDNFISTKKASVSSLDIFRGYLTHIFLFLSWTFLRWSNSLISLKFEISTLFFISEYSPKITSSILCTVVNDKCSFTKWNWEHCSEIFTTKGLNSGLSVLNLIITFGGPFSYKLLEFLRFVYIPKRISTDDLTRGLSFPVF